MPVKHLDRTLFNCPHDQQRPFTRDETGLYASLLFNPVGEPQFGSDIPLTINRLMQPQKMPFLLGIMCSRLTQAYDCKFDPNTVLLCGLTCDRPGMAVLWAYGLTMHYRATKQVMDLKTWTELLPMGIPNPAFAELCWNEQKHYNGAFDNWLDTKEAWTPQ